MGNWELGKFGKFGNSRLGLDFFFTQKRDTGYIARDRERERARERERERKNDPST